MDNPENPATQGTQDEEKHNTTCVGHHHTQTNTNYVNKTWALLQTTGGKDEPNIVNKTWVLLQTTGGKDEPNIVFIWNDTSTILHRSRHGTQFT